MYVCPNPARRGAHGRVPVGLAAPRLGVVAFSLLSAPTHGMIYSLDRIDNATLCHCVKLCQENSRHKVTDFKTKG